MLSILTTLALAAAPQAVDPIGSLQRLAVPTDPEGTVVISVELDGQPADLLLERYSLRAGDFQLLVSRPDGSLAPMPAPRPNTWRGEVPGWPDTIVTATINHEGLSAVVADYATDREWQIQPAAGLPAGTYSVARASDLPATGGVCGVGNQVGSQGTNNGPATSNLGTGLQLCEIAFDADFEFYQRNGNSVQATIDDIERIMNRVDTIYVRDVDVTIQLTGIVVRSTSADPYTTSDAGQLLDQFRNHWNQNFTGIRRDLAHLFTGRNVNGGTIGIAYLGVVCSQSVGYGLSESRFTNNLVNRTGLTAHEMGHNFNSNHCDGNGDCRIMCSGLGGCNNDVTRFGTASANGIRSYAINRPCLLDLSPPLALPVTDTFPASDHLRVKSLADIFLDTPAYNAHVTAGCPPRPCRAPRAARRGLTAPRPPRRRAAGRRADGGPPARFARRARLGLLRLRARGARGAARRAAPGDPCRPDAPRVLSAGAGARAPRARACARACRAARSARVVGCV